MSRISNKELAEALTGKHGLSKQEAEKFVAKMFEVIGNGLQSDKLVKVKGLGTFKVVGVASRKSIDVNTGEPIVIEGRDKITFTPDTSMRDSVNRPFAQFETVVLNNGVDFSEIDKKYEDSEREIDDQAEEPKEEIAVGTPTKETTVAEEPKEEETTAIEEPKTEEVPVTEEPKEEETNAIEEPKVEEATAVEEPKEEEAAVAEEPKTLKEYPEEKDAENEIKEAKEEIEVGKEYIAAQHKTLKVVCIAAAVVVILLGASAFYLYNQLQLRDHRIENLEAQVLEKNNKKASVKKTATTSNNTKQIASSDIKNQTNGKQEDAQLNPNIANEPTLPKVNAEDKKTVTAKDAAKASKQGQELAYRNNEEGISSNGNNNNKGYGNYNKDVRIRTGAYNIMGIDHTVTVRSGQTLASISRSQLGPGMECYVEAVNGGRKEFKAGEKVKIPKLKLKKRK